MALIICPNCGANVSDKASNCMKCGCVINQVNQGFHETLTRMNTDNLRSTSGVLYPNPNFSNNPYAAPPQKKSKKGVLITVIVSSAILLIAAIIVIVVLSGKKPKSIQLAKHSGTVDVGSQITLTYSILPDSASEAEITWSSSNESVAEVTAGGVVIGRGEGDCEITISTDNGCRDTCVINVKPEKPDFKKIYSEYCSSKWASVSSDGSSLSIDTNPYDLDNYSISEAYQAVSAVNKAVGFSDAITSRMGSTRAIDGTQTASTDTVEASWTYHPDHGLSVIYSLK